MLPRFVASSASPIGWRDEACGRRFGRENFPRCCPERTIHLADAPKPRRGQYTIQRRPPISPPYLPLSLCVCVSISQLWCKRLQATHLRGRLVEPAVGGLVHDRSPREVRRDRERDTERKKRRPFLPKRFSRGSGRYGTPCPEVRRSQVFPASVLARATQAQAQAHADGMAFAAHRQWTPLMLAIGRPLTSA